jgi:hypothetical protein
MRNSGKQIVCIEFCVSLCTAAGVTQHFATAFGEDALWKPLMLIIQEEYHLLGYNAE